MSRKRTRDTEFGETLAKRATVPHTYTLQYFESLLKRKVKLFALRRKKITGLHDDHAIITIEPFEIPTAFRTPDVVRGIEYFIAQYPSYDGFRYARSDLCALKLYWDSSDYGEPDSNGSRLARLLIQYRNDYEAAKLDYVSEGCRRLMKFFHQQKKYMRLAAKHGHRSLTVPPPSFLKVDDPPFADRIVRVFAAAYPVIDGISVSLDGTDLVFTW